MQHLTKSQKLIYDMEKYSGGSISIICGSILLQGETDITTLQAAANGLRRINPALCTRIVETDEGTMQVVEEYTPQDVAVLRFSDKAELLCYAEDYARKPLDLYGQLFESTVVLLPGQCGLLVKLHHIISDAWTLALMGNQYNALINGETPCAYSYEEHLQREDAYLQSERYAKDRAFFLEQFQKCEEVTYLSEKQVATFAAQRKTFVIDKERTQQLVDYTKAHGCSAFVLFMTALSAYFSRIKQNTETFYIGTAVLNRSGVREKNTAGMFINMVPMLMKLENEQTFSYNLAVVKATAFTAFRHQKFNYDDILSAVRQEYGFSERLYDVLLSYQNSTITDGDRGIESTWYHCGAQTESLQIHIDDRDNEGIFRIHFDYQTEKFTEQEIERMYTHILSLLFDAVTHENKKLYELELLSSEEKQQLLYEFNDTAVDYPKDKCVHTLFEEQAAKTPDKTAVIACDRALTYQELNEQSNQIAHGLISQGVKPGDIVAFALPRRSYLIAAIFGILKVGAAYLSIDPDYPQDRIDYMLEDSKAAYFITELNIQELLTNENVTDPMVAMTSDSLCYCIYTSGSTGRPKGTLLRHRGIVNLVTDLNIYYDLSKCKRIGFMTTITFDVATQEIFTTLLNGFTGVLATERKETRTDEIINCILDNKIDVIYATPTYLDALTDSAEKAERLLSAVKVICLAGEKFYLNRYVLSLCNRYPVIFENQYGPAEVHVITTTTMEHYSDIPIGKPIANTQIYIMDKYMRPVPIGVTGELCIAGDGVGAGYLNRPELTAEKFIDNPFGKGKLYKTGDLAYWREDGNIVYVGRNDFQVKVRGLRIELGEIENALQGVEGISQAAVVVRKNEAGRQFICAFYTGCETDSKTFRTAIGQKLPKYMLPHIFIHLEIMPLTSSGKVNRKALPEVDLNSIAAAVKYAAPKTVREIILCTAVQTVLRVEKAGTSDNFFDLGGDSLKAIELIAALERSGYSTEVKTVFAADTLGDLAKHLTAVEVEQEVAIPIGPVPATDAQVRVYTAQAMAGGTAYNVPYVFRVEQLDSEKLQAAVTKLVARHESFRTRFENRDGQVMQIVEDSANCIVEALDSEDISAFIRPFDLEAAPLLRVGYFQNTVMVDMHHIITDGGSMPVFLRELNELYMGRELDKRPVQYREFAARVHDYIQSEQYWLSIYADEPPVLEMNTDHPRQSKRTFSGTALYETLPGSLHAQICEECKTLGITPYTFYIGAFYVLLSKFSGNEDIVVGVPASGRSGKFLNSIGMFVNTLVLRGRPEGSKTTRAFLREIREMTVQALDHQDYPYGELVKKLGANSSDRNPLFDVMFTYQDEAMTDVIFGDKPTEILPIPVTTAKYDFTFNILPRKNDVVAMVEYCTDLYRESTLQRFIEGYILVLEQMLNAASLLKDISAITEQERQKLLFDFNNTTAEYPKGRSVYSLFEERANSDLNAVAVIDNGKHYSFREFKAMAEKIDSTLQRLSKGEKQIIGIIADRSVDQLAAIFGIARGGNAYMPIATDYPTHRIEQMLSQTSCNIVLAQREYSSKWKNTVCIEDILEKEIVLPMSPSSATADDMLYVIFTSGSTGTPKGAAISNRSAVNRIYWMEKKYPLGKNGVVMLKTPYIFDVSVWEIFRWGMFSGSVYVLPPNEHYNPYSILSHIVVGKVTDIHFVPTMFSVFIDYLEQKSVSSNEFSSLKNIFLSGEELKASLVNRFSAFNNGNIKLHNLYGPTECAVDVTYYDCKNTETDPIPIGKPIDNTEIYIVDKDMNILPGGSKGELCIGGDNVGIGYIQMPDLTAERFVDSPYGNGKLYKTGDLAYWREDGNIVYAGRNDFQVKIRGLRIELGEIENAIQKVEGISQAVVVVRKDEAGRQFICAFYTGCETDGKTFRTAIGQKLPKYMLPHIFMRLDTMPLTSSGKVNRKALPEVNLSMVSSAVEYIAPVGEMEKRLASLMEQTLDYSPIGRNDDFFDLGGDSLKAIEFLSKAHGEEIYFDLQNVFDYPTVETLCGYLQNGPEKGNSFAPEQFAKYESVLEQNVWDEKFILERHKLGTVFLTGGTGFLGSHILDTLIKHGAEKIYCLVRGSKERLAQRLQYYFGKQYADEIRKTIIPIGGDLESRTPGNNWPEQVDYVIHAAASVKHYGTWQYFKQANVDATAHVLAYAQRINAKLIYVSTVSVSGNSMADQFDGYVSEDEKHFYESSLYIGQSLDNVYVRSKFEAETLILDAMCQGFHANIVRMGNLTNRVSDLKFQPNYDENAFLKRVKAILDLGCLSEYPASAYVEFTPVDAAAEAVVKIMEHMNDRYTVFHVNSNRNLYFDRMLKYLAQAGYPLAVLPDAEFAKRIRATLNTPHKYIFEALSNHLNQDDTMQFDSNIHIENDFTVQYLRSIGFEWPEIDYAYIEGYLQYFEKLGYIGGVVHDAE